MNSVEYILLKKNSNKFLNPKRSIKIFRMKYSSGILILTLFLIAERSSSIFQIWFLVSLCTFLLADNFIKQLMR